MLTPVPPVVARQDLRHQLRGLPLFDMASRIEVIGFDHLVLITPDVERSLRFYSEELGLATERVQEWREGRVPFPSVRVDETTVIDMLHGQSDVDLSAGQRGNVDHLCLVVADIDLAELAASGRFTVVEGPGPRWGAQGTGTSVYVLDPDANVVELRTYSR